MGAGPEGLHCCYPPHRQCSPLWYGLTLHAMSKNRGQLRALPCLGFDQETQKRAEIHESQRSLEDWDADYHSVQIHNTHECTILELFRGLQLQFSVVTDKRFLLLLTRHSYRRSWLSSLICNDVERNGVSLCLCNRSSLAERNVLVSLQPRDQSFDSSLAQWNRSDCCDLRLRCPWRTPEVVSDFRDFALRFKGAMESR